MSRWLTVAVMVSGCGAATSGATGAESGCDQLLGADAFQQGTLEHTGVPTHLALEGAGFFVLHDETGTVYSRRGEFRLDELGYLQGPAGRRLQGVATWNSKAGDLQVGPPLLQPQATSDVVVRANLDGNATVLPGAFDPLNPATSSNFSTTMTVYDSLGAPHSTDVYFRKMASGSWEWHAMTDGGGLMGGCAGCPTEIASGTLTFDPQGRLTAQTQASTFNPLGAVNPQALTFNFGTPLPGCTGLDGLTQFAGIAATSFTSQNGYAPGVLQTFEVDVHGSVLGEYSNGQTVELGRVALALFPSPSALQHLPSNLLVTTASSGEAQFAGAGEGGRAVVVSGALEALPPPVTCWR